MGCGFYQLAAIQVLPAHEISTRESTERALLCCFMYEYALCTGNIYVCGNAIGRYVKCFKAASFALEGTELQPLETSKVKTSLDSLTSSTYICPALSKRGTATFYTSYQGITLTAPMTAMPATPSTTHREALLVQHDFEVHEYLSTGRLLYALH